MAFERVPVTNIPLPNYADGQILFGADVNVIIDVFKTAINANGQDIATILSGDREANVATTFAALSLIEDPENGDQALVLNDENEDGQTSLYSWNGSAWNLVYQISIAQMKEQLDGVLTGSSTAAFAAATRTSEGVNVSTAAQIRGGLNDTSDLLTGGKTANRAANVATTTDSRTAQQVITTVDRVNQDLKTTASPTFAGITSNGNVGVTGNVSATGNISATGNLSTSANLVIAGRNIAWNPDLKTFDIDLTNNVVLQLGQESHFIGYAIDAPVSDGQVVMFAGFAAAGNKIKVVPADLNAPGFFPEAIIGVATESFSGAETPGRITWFGKVQGSAVYNPNWAGKVLVLNPATPGGLITEDEFRANYSAPTPMIRVAAGLAMQNQAQARILVRPTFGQYLADLHDVDNGVNRVDGATLVWNDDNDRYEHLKLINDLGVIDADLLPSYIDDIIEYETYQALENDRVLNKLTKGRIYVVTNDSDASKNTTYRWTTATGLFVFDQTTAEWGSISGTVTDQTDIENALFTPTTGQLSATTLKGAINEVGSELKDVIDGVTNISFTDGDITATTVAGAVSEVRDELDKVIDGTTDIDFTDGDITAVTVAGAISELRDELDKVVDGTTDIDFDAGEESDLASTTVADAIREIYAQKGSDLGLAPLDATGRLPVERLPISALVLRGTFGSSGSTTGGDLPSLAEQGDFYICDTDDFYSTIADETFNNGDKAIYDGTNWKINRATDAVTGVKGQEEEDYRTGAVNITLENIGAAAEVHEHDWSDITTGVPTTLDGYGITDAYDKDTVDGLINDKLTTVRIEQFRIVNPDLGNGTFSYLDSNSDTQIGVLDNGWYTFDLQISGYFVGNNLVSANINDQIRYYPTDNNNLLEGPATENIADSVLINHTFVAQDEIDIVYYQGVSIVAQELGDGSVSFAKLDATQQARSTAVANATSASTADTIVKRDASGNFAAGEITATVDGKFKTARDFTLTGDVSGTASFDGSQNVTIATTVADNSHDHTTSISGSAAKWTTARQVTLEGDVTGSFSIDGSQDVNFTATVTDNSHEHTIANVTGLQGELDAKATTVTLTATALDTGWTGSEAPFSQEITGITGLLSTDNPTVDLTFSGTFATDEARNTEWGKIYRAVTGADSITLFATEIPEVELPFQIKVTR